MRVVVYSNLMRLRLFEDLTYIIVCIILKDYKIFDVAFATNKICFL